MSGPDPRLRRKTWLFVAIVILTNVSGNLALSWGMKHNPGPVLMALLDPWVWSGIALLILWTLSRLALLSWADLSFVLPVTSLGYVLNAIIGRYFLQESVTPERWAGTLLIVVGTALVGATPPRTSCP